LVENKGETLNESEIIDLIKNGDWASNDTLIINFESKFINSDYCKNSIFDDDLYRLQTDTEVKAYLFLLKLPLITKENGLTDKINTVVQKVSLLKEGAYYWWSEEGINKIISAGTINEYVCGIDKEGNEIKKNAHHAAFKMPEKFQTFAIIDYYPIKSDNDTGLNKYKEIPNNFINGSENISKSRKYYLMKYFKKWVKEEFEQNIDALENLKLRSKETNICSGKTQECIVFGNSLNTALINTSVASSEHDNSVAMVKLQGFLKRTLLGVCTIFDYYGGFYGKGMDVETNDFREGFKRFMEQLNKIYGKLADMDKNDLEKLLDSSLRKVEEDPFKNDDMRLSLYMTLKSLYNKWICGATKGENTWKVSHHNTSVDNFKYEDRTSSKNIYEGDSGLYELDNFIYMDSYYRDIGYNLKVNLTKLSEWILSQLPSATVGDNETTMNYNSKSLYQFLTEVAQDCGGVILAIPQRFMYNKVEDIKDVFTPFPSCQHWDDNTYTYMFLYNYKPAEHLGDNTTSNLDMNGWSPEGDGFNFNDDEIVGALFDNQDNGYGVPAFGVTFGKGNQSYFKDIKLSTGQYGVTEAGLNATFQIAAKGDETVRQTTLYGQDIYKVYANNSYECTVEMMGDMQIFPPMYFQLNNIPLWKGAYIIKKVTHVITPGDAKTTIVGVKQNKHMIPFSDSDIVTFVSDKDSVNDGVNGSNNSLLDLSTFSNAEYHGEPPLKTFTDISLTGTEKTNIGLVNYCKAQLGRPYWWSACGQIATEELRNKFAKTYKSTYESSYYSDTSQQYGEKVHDCYGLIKGYFYSDNSEASAVIKNSVFPFQSSSAAFKRFTVKSTDTLTMPNVPGIAVFKTEGKGGKGPIVHVGVYIGDNKTIEAEGHKRGVLEKSFENTQKLAKYWDGGWAYIDELYYYKG